MITSVILQTSMRLILPLSLLFTAYMAIKGHNEAGGGFIAGLIASAAFMTYRISMGADALFKIIPVHPRVLIVIGLSLALLTSVVPLLLGEPLLTSTTFHWPLPGGEEGHLPSAAIFDLGVMFVVIGVTVGMITRLTEELEGQEP